LHNPLFIDLRIADGYLGLKDLVPDKLSEPFPADFSKFGWICRIAPHLHKEIRSILRTRRSRKACCLYFAFCSWNCFGNFCCPPKLMITSLRRQFAGDGDFRISGVARARSLRYFLVLFPKRSRTHFPTSRKVAVASVAAVAKRICCKQVLFGR